jgi:hypothetical protein
VSGNPDGPKSAPERAELAGAIIAFATLRTMRREASQERRVALMLSSLEQLSEQCAHRYNAMEGFATALVFALERGTAVRP